MAEETKRGGAPQEALLELRHIRKVFNAGTVSEMEVFHDFSLTIHKGEFISVVGSNGSGKCRMRGRFFSMEQTLQKCRSTNVRRFLAECFRIRPRAPVQP